jgi:hypothetical protein
MNGRCAGLLFGLLAALGGSSARADDGVTLKHKLIKGETLIYRMKSEMKQNQTFMGMVIDNETNIEAFTSMTVDNIDEKGNYQLTLKSERLKLKAKFGALGEYEFDSQSSERDKSSQIGVMTTPILERLSGIVYQASLSPEGEVLEVKGYAEQLADLLQGNQLGLQFAGGGTNEAARQQLKELFLDFPKKALQPGDSWEAPQDIVLPNVGKTRSKNTYRYAGPEKVGERQTAKIEVTSEVSVDIDIEMGGAKVTGTISTTSASGVMHFDPAAGRLVLGEGTMNMAGDLSVDVNGMIIPIRNEQSIKSRVDFLEKLPD